MNRVTKQIALTMTSLLLAGSINAAAVGPYAGVGLGYSSMASFSDAPKASSDGGLGGKLFIGYKFTDNLGIEASYLNYSSTKYYYHGDSNLIYDYNMKAVALMGKVYFPLDEEKKINLYMLLGAAEVFATVDRERYSIKYESLSNEALVPIAGMGVSYDMTPHVTTSLEFTVTGQKSADDNNKIGIPQAALLGLNISYNLF